MLYWVSDLRAPGMETKVTPYDNNHSDCSLYITIYDSKLKINRNKSDKQLAACFPSHFIHFRVKVIFISDFALRPTRHVNENVLGVKSREIAIYRDWKKDNSRSYPTPQEKCFLHSISFNIFHWYFITSSSAFFYRNWFYYQIYTGI